MKVTFRVPTNVVDVKLEDVTLDDIAALIYVLDADRNHPARAELYEKLLRARAVLRPS